MDGEGLKKHSHYRHLKLYFFSVGMTITDGVVKRGTLIIHTLN